MKKKDWQRHFACRILGLMGDRDMSQTELAKEAGISDSALSNYLSYKRTPSAVAVNNLAHALDVTADSLINIDEKIE